MLRADDRHFSLVAELLADGEVIPFLGAGANLCDRPDDASWEAGRFPPSGRELADALAERSRYPSPGEPDLLRVSQYVDAILGEGQLYRYLHAVFDADYPPARSTGCSRGCRQLLRETRAGRSCSSSRRTTTTWSSERSPRPARRSTSSGTRQSAARRHGLFLHRAPDGKRRADRAPEQVHGPRARASGRLILKLHGAIDRDDAERDSYVVTEDSYIDYLAGRDVGEQIPFSLRERMASDSLLFLGYSMRDWNLRVILNRIWGASSSTRSRGRCSASRLTRAQARSRRRSGATAANVDLVYCELKEYVSGSTRSSAAPAGDARLMSVAAPRNARGAASADARTSVSCRTARTTPRSSSAATTEGDRRREPARRPADDPLRAERSRQDARCCRPASSTSCASRSANATAAERAPFAVCVVPVAGATTRCRRCRGDAGGCVEALGGEELPPWQPGESLAETLRAWTERVAARCSSSSTSSRSTSATTRTRTASGTFAAEFPRIVNDPTCAVNFLLSIREDAWAKLDRFEGRIPALFANYVRVEHLDREAAREAIEGPIEVEPRPAAGERAVRDRAGARRGGDRRRRPARLALTAGGDERRPRKRRAPTRSRRRSCSSCWSGSGATTVAAGAHTLTLARLEALGGAQQHRREPPARGARRAHARRAGRRGRRASASSSPARRRRSRSRPPTSRNGRSGRSRRSRPCSTSSAAARAAASCARSAPPGRRSQSSYELFHDVLAEPILDWRRGRERRAALGRRARIGGVVVLLLAGVLFAGLAVWALGQRSDAVRETERASSLALASTAGAQLDTRLDTALLLGLAAYESGPSVAARSTLLSGLEAARSSGLESILHGHTNAVLAVAVSPDGHTVASTGFDRTIRLWNLRTHAPSAILRGHKGTVNSVAFSPDGRTLVSASHDETVRLWDVRRRRPLGLLRHGHTEDILSVAFSPDGHTLASAGDDRTIRLWDVRTRTTVGRPLRGPAGSVTSVAFSPDGRTLAAAGSNKAVRVWNVRTRKTVAVLPAGVRYVLSVAFSPDGRTLAAAGGSGMVRLWDARTYKRLGQPLRGHTGFVKSVAFSPSGRMLASAGDDRTVRLWEVRTRRPLGQPLRGHGGFVTSVAFGAEDRTLVSGSQDGTARVWNALTRGTTPALLGPTAQVDQVAFSPDGRTIAAAADGVWLWNIRTRKASGILSADTLVYSVAFSPDGSTLASGGRDGTVLLWNVPTRRQLRWPLRRHEGTVLSVAFSPDGLTLASAGSDGTVRVWDVRTGRALLRPLTRPRQMASVAFSPDGLTLASGGGEETVRLRSVRTGATVAILRGHTRAVTSVAFSPDGRTLASGSLDNTARLWDVRTGGAVAILRGHTSYVDSVAFSPDGHTLASAGEDGTVRIWDVQTGQPLGEPLLTPAAKVFSVAFSPDGLTLAWSGDEEKVRLWHGVLWRDPAVLQSKVCSLVIGNLTKREWEELAPGVRYRTVCPS